MAKTICWQYIFKKKKKLLSLLGFFVSSQVVMFSKIRQADRIEPPNGPRLAHGPYVCHSLFIRLNKLIILTQKIDIFKLFTFEII